MLFRLFRSSAAEANKASKGLLRLPGTSGLSERKSPGGASQGDVAGPGKRHAGLLSRSGLTLHRCQPPSRPVNLCSIRVECALCVQHLCPPTHAAMAPAQLQCFLLSREAAPDQGPPGLPQGQPHRNHVRMRGRASMATPNDYAEAGFMDTRLRIVSSMFRMRLTPFGCSTSYGSLNFGPGRKNSFFSFQASTPNGRNFCYTPHRIIMLDLLLALICAQFTGI